MTWSKKRSKYLNIFLWHYLNMGLGWCRTVDTSHREWKMHNIRVTGIQLFSAKEKPPTRVLVIHVFHVYIVHACAFVLETKIIHDHLWLFFFSVAPAKGKRRLSWSSKINEERKFFSCAIVIKRRSQNRSMMAEAEEKEIFVMLSCFWPQGECCPIFIPGIIG